MTTPSPELYREIPLTRGQVAIVDAVDYDSLAAFTWYAKWDKCTQSYYAARNAVDSSGKRTTVRMHRQILGLGKGDRREGDHDNCNTLDNRRGNLRHADDIGNSSNRRKFKSNTSGFKGVSFHRLSGLYQAYLNENGRRIYLGLHPTPEQASAVVETERLLRHGKFARTS